MRDEGGGVREGGLILIPPPSSLPLAVCHNLLLEFAPRFFYRGSASNQRIAPARRLSKKAYVQPRFQTFLLAAKKFDESSNHSRSSPSYLLRNSRSRACENAN